MQKDTIPNNIGFQLLRIMDRNVSAHVFVTQTHRQNILRVQFARVPLSIFVL